jgi:hypothetical protein
MEVAQMSLPVQCMQFDVRVERDMRNMALLTGEWIRQGIVFTIERWDETHYRVTLTGGF